MNEKYMGSDFDDFLAEEGLLEETESAAVKRLLDPENSSVTLQTLDKAAQSLGKHLRLTPGA